MDRGWKNNHFFENNHDFLRINRQYLMRKYTLIANDKTLCVRTIKYNRNGNCTKPEIKSAVAKLMQRQIIQLDETIDIYVTKHNRIGHKITIFRRPERMAFEKASTCPLLHPIKP